VSSLDVGLFLRSRPPPQSFTMGTAAKAQGSPPKAMGSPKANGKVKQNGVGKIKAGDEFDPMAVRWTEKYDKKIDNLWGKVPGFLKPVLVTASVFTLGTAIRGKCH